MVIPNRVPCAQAEIRGGTGAPGLGGFVRFYATARGTLVVAEVFGLPGEGFHGFHIHEGGSCEGRDFPETGSHWGPGKKDHPDHAGDLPPLLSNDGRAFLAVVTDRFSVSDILGKTIVIHNMPDDYKTQPSGDSGEKIGCGIIMTCGG